MYTTFHSIQATTGIETCEAHLETASPLNTNSTNNEAAHVQYSSAARFKNTCVHPYRIHECLYSTRGLFILPRNSDKHFHSLPVIPSVTRFISHSLARSFTQIKHDESYIVAFRNTESHLL